MAATHVLGLSALSHDASACVVRGDEILFAGHAERYSRRKNDPDLAPGLLAEALSWGRPDLVAWYERPLRKKLRHVRAGQFRHAVAVDDLPRRHLARLGLPELRGVPVRYVGHHHSHAAAGYFTSGERHTAVLTADAIGEFETLTLGEFRDGVYRVFARCRYPHSLGLLYSAFTRRCGFSPNEEEFIVMGLAALGRPRYVRQLKADLIELTPPTFRLRRNVHRGIGDWQPRADLADLAASIQVVTEEVLLTAARWLRARVDAGTLTVMGGLGLNCVANELLARHSGFDRVTLLPNPGDAGSSLGAAAAVLRHQLNWAGPYLGTLIGGDYPVAALAEALAAGAVVGVARGRAEFGPRALGNRSLLADPRAADSRDRVNQVKGREPFRPFAPVVRQELAGRYFEMPVDASPYMQFTARCRDPRAFPGIVHVDGTSRVQTVTRAQHPGLYDLLGEYERRTGCPILLNTSLNLKGEPLVNDVSDARRFSTRTGVPVL
ncbi:carbamoyltransferase C-terminal domain-containing protein [Micromonospora sp. WMMD1102]|uniref:carbamoyltransferase C-terminal domain-containing protein n=1 Tax=Micromonospora sp. WMMD1102 TaxID=3016105 RepID=UPI002414D075|nr:carbamoyltransferase C-terminal domain-containing protein [Micromonospora sp. WMMD1102]MDG4787413.1 carbamoyltransferase C-terminal domain-containing protein [Micromonospora sp. WMMD1102]